MRQFTFHYASINILYDVPSYSSKFTFTFQYVSINIVSFLVLLMHKYHLHSNMSLLILMPGAGLSLHCPPFTFQYVSINIYAVTGCSSSPSANLHSNMSLLIWRSYPYPEQADIHLHSNMSLLIFSFSYSHDLSAGIYIRI